MLEFLAQIDRCSETFLSISFLYILSKYQKPCLNLYQEIDEELFNFFSKMKEVKKIQL